MFRELFQRQENKNTHQISKLLKNLRKKGNFLKAAEGKKETHNIYIWNNNNKKNTADFSSKTMQA